MNIYTVFILLYQCGLCVGCCLLVNPILSFIFFQDQRFEKLLSALLKEELYSKSFFKDYTINTIIYFRNEKLEFFVFYMRILFHPLVCESYINKITQK